MRKNKESSPSGNRLDTVAEIVAAGLLRRHERLIREKKRKKTHVRQSGLDSSPRAKRSWDNPGLEGEKTTEEKRL